MALIRWRQPMNKVAKKDLSAVDRQFYVSAGEFFRANIPTALTFDGVTLATLYSEILPKDADTSTSISDSLGLQIPIVSSDMDTVTESQMAIAMALNGGIGLIHFNMTAKDQVAAVARVKRHIHGLIRDPITVSPSQAIGDVLAMIDAKRYRFSTFPVVDDAGRLRGLLSGNTVKERYRAKNVADVMTPRSHLITERESHVAKDPIMAADRFFSANVGINKMLLVDRNAPLRGLITERESHVAKDPIMAADRFFSANVGINKMLLVDRNDHLRGLITASDVERITGEAKSRRKPSRDSQFRLVAGAALLPKRKPDGSLDREAILSHVGSLVDEHVDAVAVSTAHGHTAGVGDVVRLVRGAFPSITLIAGNVTSAAGVEFLADCGADAVKIGQGPGSICTTRIVAGVGIPQLTALFVASTAARRRGVRLLADGGITKSGDIVKALTMADAVICGGVLAGCREAPGEIMEIAGKAYKQYRGMGSLSAMKAGSAARYGRDREDSRKVAAEGIEALKEVSGSVDEVLTSLIGGVQSGMGYLGARTLADLRRKARFARVSPAGQKEAGPHDVVEVSTRSH